MDYQKGFLFNIQCLFLLGRNIQTENDTLYRSFYEDTYVNYGQTRYWCGRSIKSKCCESCVVKSKYKKLQEIICSVCMSWFHEQCVGLKQTYRSSILSCLTCRQIPKTVTMELSALKNEPSVLKQSTDSSASILLKSIAGRFRPVSYPDGPITARYRVIKMLTCILTTASNWTSNIEWSVCNISDRITAISNKYQTRTKLQQKLKKPVYFNE